MTNKLTYLTIQEFADVLRVSRRTVASMIASNEIRVSRLAHRRIVRIPSSELDRLLAPEVGAANK
jgi:excisionase family DNA binding protein